MSRYHSGLYAIWFTMIRIVGGRGNRCAFVVVISWWPPYASLPDIIVVDARVTPLLDIVVNMLGYWTYGLLSLICIRYCLLMMMVMLLLIAVVGIIIYISGCLVTPPKIRSMIRVSRTRRGIAANCSRMMLCTTNIYKQSRAYVWERLQALTRRFLICLPFPSGSLLLRDSFKGIFFCCFAWSSSIDAVYQHLLTVIHAVYYHQACFWKNDMMFVHLLL